MDKVPNQKSIEIQPIPFQNYDPINSQLEHTGKIVVVLKTKPKTPLHYVVYPISGANSSTPFNLFICLKQNS